MGTWTFIKIASACIGVLACMAAASSTNAAANSPAIIETASESPAPSHNYNMHRHLLHLLRIADSLARRDFKEVARLADQKLGLQSSGGKRDAAPEFVEPDQNIWELGWRFRQQGSRLSELAKAAAENPAQVDAATVDREFVNLAKACHECHAVLKDP
ncbi:MAG: hypothetical protein CMM77_15405 [Rhodospirillaceae bacterium]|nr:hypothetical protein [Rhodospirillaceae bacterium]